MPLLQPPQSVLSASTKCLAQATQVPDTNLLVPQLLGRENLQPPQPGGPSKRLQELSFLLASQASTERRRSSPSGLRSRHCKSACPPLPPRVKPWDTHTPLTPWML
jgi:hypothetical protein